jgi:hypothetical protein
MGDKPKPVNPLDDNMCPYHNLKLIYFCEDCMLECCKTCKEEKKCARHAVKLLSDASLFVIDKYKDNLEQITDRKKLIKDALKIDPTTQPFPEGRLNFVE